MLKKLPTIRSRPPTSAPPPNSNTRGVVGESLVFDRPTGLSSSLVLNTRDLDRPALSRELNQFLIEVSVALHRYSMYPSGHPSLAPAVESVQERLGSLLEDRPSIAFGVARRQLIIDGVATDPDQPVLRRLAETLHAHHLGAVSFWPGVQAEEIADAFTSLAAEPERPGAVGRPSSGAAPAWPHLKLHPLTFDGLALVGDAPMLEDEETGKVDGPGTRDRAREAELWVGLARAALSIDENDEATSIPTEPSVVARAIDEHPSADAYDQVVVGYLLQIGRELKTATSAGNEGLRSKASSMIAALKPETLRRLVEMGGDAGQRGEFVLDATHGMAVDAVMEVVKAAAHASGQTISHGLTRMLTKLAAHAEAGPAPARRRADLELRDQVTHLLSEWNLEDPNPVAYNTLLQQIATSEATAEPLADDGSAVEEGAAALRIVQMSLESGDSGPLVTRALEGIIQSGRPGPVLDLLASPPDGCEEVAEAVLDAIVSPDALRVFMYHEPVDVRDLERLFRRASPAGVEVFLDALAASEDRTTRRKLLDLLLERASEIGELVAARLGDDRWHVQRNMLVILERSGHRPDDFSPSPWTTHPEARVRQAAIRLQLTLPSERAQAVRTALSDTDLRVVALALAAVQDSCPPGAVPRVAEVALQPDAGDDVRLLATGILGRVRRPQALSALLRLTDGGRSLLGNRKLPPRSPLLLVAIGALAEGWAAVPRAAAVLAIAARSPDRDVRQAAEVAGQ